VSSFLLLRERPISRHLRVELPLGPRDNRIFEWFDERRDRWARCLLVKDLSVTLSHPNLIWEAIPRISMRLKSRCRIDIEGSDPSPTYEFDYLQLKLKFYWWRSWESEKRRNLYGVLEKQSSCIIIVHEILGVLKSDILLVRWISRNPAESSEWNKDGIASNYTFGMQNCITFVDWFMQTSLHVVVSAGCPYASWYPREHESTNFLSFNRSPYGSYLISDSEPIIFKTRHPGSIIIICSKP
jgi:hypothetical protein